MPSPIFHPFSSQLPAELWRVKLTRSKSAGEGKAPIPLYSMEIIPIAYNDAKCIWQYHFFPNPQYHTNIGIQEYWYIPIFGDLINLNPKNPIVYVCEREATLCVCARMRAHAHMYTCTQPSADMQYEDCQIRVGKYLEIWGVGPAEGMVGGGLQLIIMP